MGKYMGILNISGVKVRLKKKLLWKNQSSLKSCIY